MAHLNVFNKDSDFVRTVSVAKAKNLGPDEYVYCVTCAVIQYGKIILEEKSRNRIDRGLLDFCSGHVEGDESPDQAMIRELGEELGIPESIARHIVREGRFTATDCGRTSQSNFHCIYYSLNLPAGILLTMQPLEVGRILRRTIWEVSAIIHRNEEFVIPYGHRHGTQLPLDDFLRRLAILASAPQVTK